MQLIFETERSTDIKGKMSALEESVGEKIITNAIMDSLKHISNGNKENVQTQDLISRNEKNVNNIILGDEELNAPVIEVDLDENLEHNITNEEDVTNNIEESVNNDPPDTTESYDNCNDTEEVLLTTEENDCGREIVSRSCNDEKGELQLIKQEVDDILAQQVNKLTNRVEPEETNDQNLIAEETHDDRIKEMRENLVNSHETVQILDNTTEEPLQQNPIPVEDDVTSSVNDVVTISDQAQGNQVAEESETTVEVTPSVAKESEVKICNEDKNIPQSEDNKQYSCGTETFTIQDESDDVDKTIPEPINIDELCKDIDVISDKEDNEITLLDSPGSSDIHQIEKENNLCNTAMDCDDDSELVVQDKVSEMCNKNIVSEIVDNGEVSEITNKEHTQDATFIASKDEVMIIDKAQETAQKRVEDIKDVLSQNQIENETEKTIPKSSPLICRLSNSLNILSDDEDESSKTEAAKDITPAKQCINLEEDDDIMLIDEETNIKDSKPENIELNKTGSNEYELPAKQSVEQTDLETGEKTIPSSIPDPSACIIEEATSSTNEPCMETNEKQKPTEETGAIVIEKPLLPDNFLKSSRKNIADMTREDLEEFCILKIVESIVDRSNLSEIKTKLKAMAQNLEDYKKKAMMLTKQNRDLEVVLKSVQEEQKRTNGAMVTPLKITRSVGMQVYMTDKLLRKKSVGFVSQQPLVTMNKTRSSTNILQKPNKIASSPTIPVPRLIPANNAAIRGPVPQSIPVNSGKQVNTVQVNGVRNPTPVQKNPEKRPIGKSQVMVDLTDDEPPAKIASRGPTPPVRLVPSQNLLAPQRAQFGQTMNTPRKVYIPISGPQGQQIKPGQTLMVKTSPNGPNRQRPIAPTITRLTTNQVRMNRVGQTTPRHPAALPDVVKQYQPPNWKALPPAPDLKLSKVENGIVISWKIEGYQEDSYEEIASYQLYAYQETSSPPSTALWKKIGDVKALPLPMACTLTQFMAGFKYYFAVRAVDVKSRVGPFSLPGSILLLNKM